MTYSISYQDYLNKVYGCWLGKCVSGTIGAPAEGMKQLLNFQFDHRMLDTVIPNDDLDLQVLWLHVLEQKGCRFTSNDLAAAFSEHCAYAPGEYAVFKKNYRRGIAPPLCGSYNNTFYKTGMGSPIRSEIWACIAPGNPILASELAARDACLDHTGSSIYAEQFMAAIEASAFFKCDINTLITEALDIIRKEDPIYSVLLQTYSWCQKYDDWRYVRGLIIRDFGHPSCTHVFQNMAFIILALCYGNSDIIDSTMIALNCGYDTDSTCASVGSLLGIIHGAQELIDKHNFKDFGYKLELSITRRSENIYDLAEDTCNIGLYFNKHLNDKLIITDAPNTPIILDDTYNPITFETIYDNNDPGIEIGQEKNITLKISNTTDQIIHGTPDIQCPEFWNCSYKEGLLSIPAHSCISVYLSIYIDDHIPVLHEKNIISCTINTEKDQYRHDFGIIGAAVWKIYGPFWETSQNIIQENYFDSYFHHIQGKNANDRIDRIHRYHNNNCFVFDNEIIPLNEFKTGVLIKNNNPAYEERIIHIHGDRFSYSDITHAQGPGILYLYRELISPENREVCIQVGHTDSFALYLNDELIASEDHADWSTSGNRNCLQVPLKKGLNHLVFKIARHSADADFSIIIRKENPWKDHFHDFGSQNPYISIDM